MKTRWVQVVGLMFSVALLALPVCAATVNVALKLPVRAKVNLEGRETVTLTPFVVVRREGEDVAVQRQVDVQKEFDRYMRRVLRRHTDLRIIEPMSVEYPTFDLEELARDEVFWSAVGERSGAEVILSGSLDFDMQDKSGYRTEEYISPFDGRTYYRQVLVEQTGFEYDIVLQVYDGITGRQLYSDNFKDFRQFEGESTDPLAGMFENLRALEDRIAGVFTQKQVETSRVLFTN